MKKAGVDMNKKFLSILLLVALLLTTVINPSVSHAIETVPEEAGKVFAGWYKDAQFNTPLGENETTDNAYPKFVDEDVLSVKLQITKGTETTSASSDLRLLTTVDSLMYDSVGFEITIGDKTITRTSKTVYTEITGTDGNVPVTYGPDAFSQESEAFAAYSLTDIPNDIFTSKITVKPIWITLDGTKVTGITREFSIRLFAENRIDNCTTIDNFVGSAWSSVEHNATMSSMDDGSGSVQVNCWNGWPAATLTVSDKTYDEIMEYDYVSFKVYIDSTTGLREGKKEVVLWNNTKAMYLTPGEWYHLSISTDDFVTYAFDSEKNAQAFSLLMIQNCSDDGRYDANAKAYIDDIYLIDEPGVVALSGFVGGSGATFTHDMGASHTADESGSVIMYSNGNAYASVSVKLGLTQEELSGYEALTFWIKPQSPAGGTEARIQIGQNAYNYPVGAWSQIAIPTSQLSVDSNTGAVKLFNMLNDAGELTVKDYNMQVYIDDVRLVRESNGIMASNFVPDYASQGGSFSYDVTVSHTADGSGSVKMSCGGRIWPHAALKLGITQDELSEYETLSFWIMMESPSGNEQVRMYVPASDYADNYTVGKWYQIKVSTVGLMNSDGIIDLFYMLNDTAGVGDPQANIYIDDIVLNRPVIEPEDYMPTSLTVSFYDVAENIYGFTFNTLRKSIEPVIKIKKTGEEQWKEYAMTTVQEYSYDDTKKITSYISKAEIKLEENTSYTYYAYDKGMGLGTAETTLQTKSSNADKFMFAHLSDSQEGPEQFGRVLGQIVDHADFMIHTGDVVETSKYEYEWKEMLDGNYKDVTRIPIMAISGNHETTYKAGSNETFKHFNHMIPAQESTTLGYFYSYVYGNVKFIMLNTNDLTSDTLKAEQYDWLINELENNTCKWTIVSMHNPMYSAGAYGSDSSRNGVAVALQGQLQSIFAQYDVDLVLQGHDHVISRTYPINASGKVTKESIQTIGGVEYSTNPAGVIYLENGPSGSQTRTTYSGYNSTLYKYAQSSNAASWAEIEVDGDSLVVTVKWHDGTNVNVYQKWGIIKDGSGNGGSGDEVMDYSIGLVELSDFVANYSGYGGNFSYDGNVSHTNDGSGSVVMSSNGNAWPRVAVNLGMTQEELAKYESLSFWFMAESPAGNTQSRIKVRPLNTTANYDVGVWHQVTIPTSSITLDANGVVALISTYNDALETGQDLNVKIYVDDMVLNMSKTIGLVELSDFVANYGNYGGNFSYDANVSHTDDGSGSVVMSSNGNAWPRVAVNLGVTQEQLSGYESLSFWFMAESPAGNTQVKAKVRPLNATAQYNVGEWHQVTIPTSNITLDANGVVALFSLYNDALETGQDLYTKIYIDDMIFE